MKRAASPIPPRAEAIADAFGEAFRDMLLQTYKRVRLAALPGDPCAEVLAAVCAAHVCGFLRRFVKPGADPRALLENVIAAAFDAGDELDAELVLALQDAAAARKARQS